MFTCPTNGQTIPFSMRCNGYADCIYSEDEMNCDTNNLPEIRPDPVWNIDDTNFDQALMQGRNLVVDFYAPWCQGGVFSKVKVKI